jgi:hypothetical protein
MVRQPSSQSPSPADRRHVLRYRQGGAGSDCAEASCLLKLGLEGLEGYSLRVVRIEAINS